MRQDATPLASLPVVALPDELTYDTAAWRTPNP
jgi:hypothetical protein